jgi:hypothetical protein
MMVTMMMLMLISARPLALASCEVSARVLHWAMGRCDLCDISVEREWERDAEDEEDHDGASIAEQPEEWHVIQGREEGVHDFWYRVADNDAKGHHTTKRTAL